MPAGVRAAPTLTATAWTRLAPTSPRDPLARSITAAAGALGVEPASHPERDHTASESGASSGVSIAASNSPNGSCASGSSAANASQKRSSPGESSLGSSACSERSSCGSSAKLVDQPIELLIRDTAKLRRGLPRGMGEKRAGQALSEGPRPTPQQRLTFSPLPHEHSALRPTFAVTASSPSTGQNPRRLADGPADGSAIARRARGAAGVARAS